MTALNPNLSLPWVPAEFARVVVVSPHMDDAILSCGGLLNLLLQSMPCVTVTICTADPEGADEKNPPHGIALPSTRRSEEVRAMQALGCALVQMNLLDAIYRKVPGRDELLYPSLNSLWNMPRQEDDSQREKICTGLQKYLPAADERPTLYLAPAGIGHHVDHIISTQAVLNCVSRCDHILLYEDFPYVVDQGAHVGVADSIDKALARLGVVGVQCFEQACDVDEKIKLIAHYETQIDSIFGSHQNVKPLLLKNARNEKTLEKFWRVRKV